MIRRILKRSLAILIILAMVGTVVSVSDSINIRAAVTKQTEKLTSCKYGIKGNGIGGIYININSSPYNKINYNGTTYGWLAYGPAGGTWYAAGRVTQLMNLKTPAGINAGPYWWRTTNNLNLEKGQEMKAPSVLCWAQNSGGVSHLAVLEKFSDDGQYAYISEGGAEGYSDADHGYAVIRQVRISDVTKCGDREFLGYVYLNGAKAPTTVTPAKPGSFRLFVKSQYSTNENISVSWTVSANAQNYGIIVKNSSGSIVFSRNVTGTSYSMGKLSAGSYTVTMTPYNTSGSGTAVSSGFKVTAPTPPQTPTMPPSTPIEDPTWGVDEDIRVVIAYNVNGGTGVPAKHDAAVDGNIATYSLSTTVPSRYGYKFKGWRLENDDAYDIDRPGQSIAIEVSESGTLTYYAQWEVNLSDVSYVITYSLNGGVNNSSNLTRYNAETPTFLLRDPTRNGYVFGGWYADSSFRTRVTQIVKGSTGNKVFYAKWTAVSYNITYYLNGGSNSASNPSRYNVATETILLKNPSRSGYTFKGWYLDSGFKTKATSIVRGSTGNKTFYAKWEKNPSPVSTGDIVSVNGGSSAKNAANAGITYYTQSKKYSNKDNKYWNGKVWIGSNGKDYSDKSSASCGICCDAMIASYFGANLTPGDLLQANGGKASWDGDGVKNLMEKKGLTKNNGITNGNMSQKEKKEKLDECLKKYRNDPGHNGPPMVSIDSKKTVKDKKNKITYIISNHFVLVVGKDKSGNYIIIDPAVDGRVTLKVPEEKNVYTNNTEYTSYIKGVFTWTKK